MTKDKPSQDERRVFPRKTLRTKIIFEDEKGEGFIYFYSTDISEGGVFFEHDVPLKMGTKIFLSFRLPAQKLIRSIGEVVRQEIFQSKDKALSSKQASGTIVGMGLRFVDLDPEQREIIRYFIGE